MIELKILLDEVDYRSLSEVLIPALAESMAKDGSVLGGISSPAWRTRPAPHGSPPTRSS